MDIVDNKEKLNKTNKKSGNEPTDFCDVQNSAELNEEEKEQLKEIVGNNVDNIDAEDKNHEEILSKDVVKEKLEEVATQTAPTKRKKNKLVSIILLIVNVLLVYFLASSLINSTDNSSIDALIKSQGSNLKYLWGCAFLFVIVMVADSLLISTILKTTTGKFRLLCSYGASSIGKYYEAITPFCMGGQPAQIVYLSKRNVKPGIATSVPIIRVTLVNFVTLLVASLLFFVKIPNISGGSGLMDAIIGVLEILAFIGFIINLLYFIAMFVIATSKKTGKTLARFLVRVGYKLKIFKNYRVAYKKIINQVREYGNCIDYLKKHILTLILTILLVLVEIVALASMTFFVVIALSDIQFASSSEIFAFYIDCLLKYYICYFASAYIPLPGGTGMMELSFVILFSSVIGSDFIAWGFLIWRLFSYYLVLLQGFLQTIGNFVSTIISKKSATIKKSSQ